MKNINSTLIATLMGVIGFASISISASDADERNVLVEIHKASDENTTVDINVNGNVEVFSLPTLEVGETQDIVTESGNTISVTKSESGISLIVDGEEINLPAVGAEMSAHFMKGGMPLHKDTSNSIQVIGDLTEEQIAIIKDGFAAANVDKEISFTKGHEMMFFSHGGNAKNFDIQFDTSDVSSWKTKDGNHVKIIKLDDGDGVMEIKTKMLIIHQDNKSNLDN
ncbi:MAG: hypothetical protein COB38_12175 [Gammaproteobacteria bacterium]|nr:MAG: hypothetical protein COB38_12175 [Gammaproteobacteria bacterium]